jgi:dihydrolipoamide dehydrogenase
LKKLGDRLIINDDVFEWKELPESVAVIGPGVIGLELGQALHRLGVRVAVLGRGSRIGPITDPDIRASAMKTLGSQFALDPDARMTSMQRDGDRVAIVRRNAEGTEFTEHFDYVLAATGRAPNVNGIGLDKTTVDCDASGVPVFDTSTMQTVTAAGPGSIFVAGDSSNFIPLLHEAADEGRIAGENAAVSLQENRYLRPAARTAWHRIHRSADRNSGRRLVGARDRSFRCGSGQFRASRTLTHPVQEPWSAACLWRHRDGTAPRRRNDRSRC